MYQSINQTLFIKHLKNTEVYQSAVQKAHTKHTIQLIIKINKYINKIKITKYQHQVSKAKEKRYVLRDD